MKEEANILTLLRNLSFKAFIGGIDNYIVFRTKNFKGAIILDEVKFEEVSIFVNSYINTNATLKDVMYSHFLPAVDYEKNIRKILNDVLSDLKKDEDVILIISIFMELYTLLSNKALYTPKEKFFITNIGLTQYYEDGILFYYAPNKLQPCSYDLSFLSLLKFSNLLLTNNYLYNDTFIIKLNSLEYDELDIYEDFKHFNNEDVKVLSSDMLDLYTLKGVQYNEYVGLSTGNFYLFYEPTYKKIIPYTTG